MNRILAAGLVVLLALGAPLSAWAQTRGERGGGFNLRESAPATRPVTTVPQARPAPPAPPVRQALPAPPVRPALPPPPVRPAPPVRQAQPVAQPPANGGGYRPPAAPPANRGGYRPPAPPNGGGYHPPANGGNYRPPAPPPPAYYRPPGSNSHGYYNGYHGPRGIVANPVYRGPAWGWNRGIAWYPAPTYWGGGFWGALAIGITAAAVFGAIVDADQQQVVSYQVEPNSPGATLLANYQLTQVPCGPPDLVVIFGPDNSVICAYPNNLVSAGEYDLDAQQLTIISR